MINKLWHKYNIGELFSIHSGLGISREQLGDKGIPYLHYGDMHKGSFSSVSYDDYVNLPRYDIEIRGDEDFLLKDGDVVFLDASEDLAGTSRCVVVDNPDNKPFIAGLHTLIARPLNNSLNKLYKKYFTQTQDVQKQFECLAIGFKVYGVNRNDIKKIIVSFPKDIKEQKKIAQILTKWDKAIELQEQLIEKLKLQKKGLMQKIIENSNKNKLWCKCNISELFSFTGGLGISREQLGDKGIPYLHYGDMHKGNFSSVSYDDYANLPKYDIEIIGDENFLLKDGDIVFLDASEDLAGTSRCVVVHNPDNKPFIAGLHTFIARPLNNSLDKSYKKYFTQTQDVQKQFERLAVGFKVYGVNRNDIKKIIISFPKDIKEQQKIAKILTKLDKAIELRERLIKKLKLQKKGLMQLLLTGKKRVKI